MFMQPVSTVHSIAYSVVCTLFHDAVDIMAQDLLVASLAKRRCSFTLAATAVSVSVDAVEATSLLV